MTAKNQDIEVWEGDTVIIQSTVEKDGVAQDISGHTIEWFLYDRAIDATPEITKSTDTTGVTVTDAPNGVYEIKVESSETDQYSGRYFHRGRITKPNGNKVTMFEGAFYIKNING